jgi:hypothetical protein
MTEEQETQPQEILLPVRTKRSIWQKLGAGSLSISIVFHAILLIIGVVWVLQVIPPPEKKVDFMPPSGGGGSPASTSTAKQHRVQMMQPNMARVAAVGATSGFTLPEPDQVSQMSSLGSLSSGGLAGGLGGSGAGGGKGTGNGLGIGAGMAPGLSMGRGNKNPFGMLESNVGGLAGTFYDLKQTKDLQPTDIDDDGVRDELKVIAAKGFRPRDFAKYFKAPRALYQTKFMIPLLAADKAPAAFEVDQHVQPRRWFVVYQGAVRAPKTGKFRFVGAGDDTLMVRINNRLVFDYGYTLGCTGGGAGIVSAENVEKDKNSDTIKNFKRSSPMPVPNINYQYSSTPRINKDIGGVAVGAEFPVTAGKTYPIEIILSEIPGGVFTSMLFIQEEGVTYEKDPAGYPILPIFRLDNSQPDTSQEQMPPFDPNGPVWKFVPGVMPHDI